MLQASRVPKSANQQAVDQKAVFLVKCGHAAVNLGNPSWHLHKNSALHQNAAKTGSICLIFAQTKP